MKKFFRTYCTVILTMIFFLASSPTVSAKKNDWVDKDYNFSNVRRVYLREVDTSAFNKLEDELAEQIQSECKNFAFSKLKGVILVDSEEFSDIKIIPKIIAWETERIYVPEDYYYEGYETKTTRDRDGKKKEERHYKRSKFWFLGATRKIIPAHYVYYSVLKVSYEVYDVKSGNLIMKRNDERRRDGLSEHLKMYKRSCKAFFKILNKFHVRKH